MNTTNERTAIDLPAERRPGVPAQREPEPMANAHWSVPEQQVPRGDVTIDGQRAEPTATFGTGQPPRGLSGVLRRAAYQIPDYEPRRWALLLFADRVDTLEDRLSELARTPVPWIALAIGAGALAYARFRPRRRTWLERLIHRIA